VWYRVDGFNREAVTGKINLECIDGRAEVESEITQNHSPLPDSWDERDEMALFPNMHFLSLRVRLGSTTRERAERVATEASKQLVLPIEKIRERLKREERRKRAEVEESWG